MKFGATQPADEVLTLGPIELQRGEINVDPSDLQTVLKMLDAIRSWAKTTSELRVTEPEAVAGELQIVDAHHEIVREWGLVGKWQWAAFQSDTAITVLAIPSVGIKLGDEIQYGTTPMWGKVVSVEGFQTVTVTFDEGSKAAYSPDAIVIVRRQP